MNNTEHEKYMSRCFELAKKGLGSVAPNPIVGAVIVHNNIIIGEGYHHKYGSHHAEVNAINNVKDKSLLKQSTIYVSLEPCAHYGKTPPCCDLILKYNIPTVIIANIDPNKKTAGQSITKLKEHGIEVITNVLSKKGKVLNKRFFTHIQKQRPYIILKWAETQNGYINKITNSKSESIAISDKISQNHSHKWRSEEQAILVGSNTAKIDNPTLTTRNYVGKNPVRIVLDSKLNCRKTLNLFSDENSTIIINTQLSKTNGNKEYIKVSDTSPTSILNVLNKKDITSIIIEGGKQVLQSFINENAWDEARVFKSTVVTVKEGIKAPKIDTNIHKKESLNNDILFTYLNNNKV